MYELMPGNGGQLPRITTRGERWESALMLGLAEKVVSHVSEESAETTNGRADKPFVVGRRRGRFGLGDGDFALFSGAGFALGSPGGLIGDHRNPKPSPMLFERSPIPFDDPFEYQFLRLGMLDGRQIDSPPRDVPSSPRGMDFPLPTRFVEGQEKIPIAPTGREVEVVATYFAIGLVTDDGIGDRVVTDHLQR